MANTYKTVGYTTAKVVSLLAVAGGVLWWARTPAPVEIPRPQDEAEIMHAILERHYAMGRNGTQFTTSYSNNVSKIITSGVSSNVYEFASSLTTNSNGTNYYVVRGYTHPEYFCAWTSGTRLTLLTGGSVLLTNQLPGGAMGRNIFVNPFNSIASTFDVIGPIWNVLPKSASQIHTGTPPHSAECGIITFTNLVQTDRLYITNSVAHTNINTIGFSPNATFRYPNLARSAMDDGAAFYNYWKWLTPSNVFMTTGLWDGNPSGWRMSEVKYLDTDTETWTNYVTLPTGRYYTTTNYATTNVVYTNFPPATNWFWQTNVTYNSQRYTNTVLTDAVSTGKLFAFERDLNKLYWSTNAYNDMARALSLMQWQVSDYCDWVYDTNSTHRWTIGYYTNNVGTTVFDTDWKTNSAFTTPRATLQYHYYRGSEVWYKEYKGSVSNGRLVANPAHIAGTNFVFTNCYFGYTNITKSFFAGLGGNSDYIEFPGVPAPGWSNGIINCLSPSNFTTRGEAVTSDWVFALSPTLPTREWIDADFAATTAVWEAESAANPGTIREYFLTYGWETDYTIEYAGYVFARPVFQSITNYTRHGKAR